MSGVFDRGDVERVQRANDIIDVIGEHIKLSRKGSEMVGLCPFHEDHRPSLYVSGTKQIFKCFACGAGGDVLKFVQMRENLTFPQAIERLAQRAGVPLTRSSSPLAAGRQQAEQGDPNAVAKVNDWAAEYFRRNLDDEQIGKSARRYVAERRISAETAGKWRLGLAGDLEDGLVRAAAKKSIPPKLLEEAGLVVGGKAGCRDKFISRLMFTITDATGRVVGFGGRTLKNAGAKYINTPTTVLFDKSNTLYGLRQARHEIVSSGRAVVVEGYTDCLMAHQFGCGNVVATLGTSFTTGHGRLLKRYAKEVVLLFDNDVAGVEAANRALDVCVSLGIDIRIGSVPGEKDPCDFILAAGKEEFGKLVADAADVFQFRWDRLAERFSDKENLAERRAAIDEYLQTVVASIEKGNLTPIDRGLIVNRLSKVIGLDGRQINAELGRRLRRRRSRTATEQRNGEQAAGIDWGRGGFAAAQREILEVLLNQPDLFRFVRGKITAGDFDVPILGQIAALLFTTLGDEPGASLKAILARTDSVQTGKCIVELAETGEKKGNFRPRLTAAMEAMRRYGQDRDKNRVQADSDQAGFLRSVCERVGKKNPHSIGMTD